MSGGETLCISETTPPGFAFFKWYSSSPLSVEDRRICARRRVLVLPQYHLHGQEEEVPGLIQSWDTTLPFSRKPRTRPRPNSRLASLGQVVHSHHLWVLHCGHSTVVASCRFPLLQSFGLATQLVCQGTLY